MAESRGLRVWRALWIGAAVALPLTSCAPEADPRPLGTVEDVLALGARDDLNVLFILVDTLRADRLGSYGYERETSPFLDALASTGVRFDAHVGQSSWTKCSMASLWTGLYPNRTGVRRAQHALPEGALLPAEILRESGFRTAGIFRNGWVAANFGFDQGFEVYMTPAPHVRAQADTQANPGSVAGSDEDIIRSALEFLRVHSQERWFLYLHLLDVHQYAADEPSAIFGTRYSDIYDNAILWTDKLIAHLVGELDRQGLRDRTLIVFASDHGEAFGEHGAEGHARDVYGEVIQTPLLLSFPFRLEPGLVVGARSENVDVWPTVLDLVGGAGLEDPDGHSLVPAIVAAARGEVIGAGDTAVAQIDHAWGQLEEDEQRTIVSMTRNRWRLVYDETRPGYLELFDKESDPREQRNLARKRPKATEELMALVREYLARSDAPWGRSPVIDIDEMQMRQLRAIGYGVE
jgi:arylsulfatase A-like enzyme